MAGDSVNGGEIAGHYPVVVIGAGPCGLVLTNLLGRENIPVLQIERHKSTVGEPRAVSIDDESLRTMQAAGLVEEVQSRIVPGYGSHYLSPDRRRFATVHPTGRPYGYPRRNAFRQQILERQLREGVQRFSSITLRFEWELVAFEQSPSAVHLTLRDPTGTERQVSCDYLIGCDGAHSTVRRALDIPLEGSTFDERWLIIDLENAEAVMKHTQVFCDPRRAGITLPGPDKTRRYEFKLHPHETDEEILDPVNIAKLLQDHGAEEGSTICRQVIYGFHARIARRWQVGRIFLAGDAAHLTPPFAGQGMNSGIRDAYNLSWKLAAVVQGKLGRALLDTYELERRDHAWSLIEMALRMGRIMSPDSMLQAWLVQTAFRLAAKIPFARSYVSEMRFKPPPRFTQGFLLPEPRTPGSLVGRLFPQPFVRNEAGDLLLLDELTENRFALVARTSEPALDFAASEHSVWDRLGAVRLAILPRGSEIAPVPGVTQVTEENETLAKAMAPYRDHYLLLRPDHYVAAAIPRWRIQKGAAELEALVRDSWAGAQPVAGADTVATTQQSVPNRT